LTSVILTPMLSWWKFHFYTVWFKVFKIVEVVLSVSIMIQQMHFYIIKH
jgi:hypothetical protein